MNKVILIGRITKDPEVKQTPSNLHVCSFTIAVDRKFKDNAGNKLTDFINCVAWRQLADLLGNYFHKGSKIGLTGSLQSRSYDDQNGNRRTVIEVLVEEIEFLDPKQQTQEEPFEERPVPPMPKNEPEELANMQYESDMADAADVALPFDICGY